MPIHKRGDSRTPSNYRPISILPYLSKIFEKIVYYRLLNHFANNNILSPVQFGFRKNTSTLDAIVHFTELIYNSLNNKETVLNILIDFSKAFDTVNHTILLRKLEKYGVRGSALLWIGSYLRNRKQFVCVGEEVSETRVTNISVPQGSILGPLLFLIHINDLPNVSEAFSSTMFADDCTLSIKSPNFDEIISTCNAELAKYESWAASNRLSLNVDKTKCLLISNIHNHYDTNRIKLNGHDLEFVTSSKFLGIILDNQLKYDEHIRYICSKISKSIGILYRLRDIVPNPCLKMIYFSLIHPYLLYCLPIFGATYAIHLQPLICYKKKLSE